jgi:octaprenyl-diphosphate synthase
VALAARLGAGFSPAALELAVAVELVHNATLLHDDVIDLGETRRGAVAARLVYGNAASIFAGDWLLVEAIRRIELAGVPGTLARALEVIDEMIRAEALQLARRGRLDGDRATYLRIVEGKTAALFRWALFAGARAGGLSLAAEAALDDYGRHLGIAFQLVDDLLDFTGEARTLGKAPFADLREGKLTYPLLLAIERRPALRDLLCETIGEAGDAPVPPAVAATVLEALEQTGALADARALAEDHAASAARATHALPAGPAREALATIATATVTREH